MFINFTMHALARIRQRGKSTEGVKMVLRHGTNRGHSSRVMFKKDSLREIERRQQWLKRLFRLAGKNLFAGDEKAHLCVGKNARLRGRGKK